MSNAKLENISKFYGNVTAVDNVSLEILDNQFLVLVGPSGCGKSTTLRMIAGLERASIGEIWIDNIPVNHVSPRDRDIAMVFQSYALYPHMSVEKNLSYSLRIQGKQKSEINARVKNVAEILELSNLLKRKPFQLSGGQRQRVALGRAIVRSPKLFLMDEPLSNLDAKLRVQTRAELIRLQRNLGTTTIYVTHDQTEAMTMGTTVVVMNEGKIQQVDHPKKVYQYPANTFVAQFIGMPPMNLFDCSIIEEKGKINCLCGNRFVLELPNNIINTFQKLKLNKVIAGLRPEDFSITSEDKAKEFKHLITGEIDLIESLGHENILYICDDKSEDVKYPTFAVRTGLDQSKDFRVGDIIYLEPNYDRIRFFKCSDGIAIY